MEWAGVAAALFDLDGVLTPTAVIHRRAWREMFDAFLASRGVGEPFTEDDYFRYVDGKARDDGIRDFLASRGIELDEGSADDAPGTTTVRGLGHLKNGLFNQVLERDGMEAYPGSTRLVAALAARDLPMAVVSSSRNTRAVLAAARLTDFFPVVVDGTVARDRQLAGKPAPDTFLAAAAALGVEPGRAAVVEDAVAGVAAGRAGGFSPVIGVDRGAGAEALRANGADLVVADLAELLP